MTSDAAAMTPIESAVVAEAVGARQQVAEQRGHAEGRGDRAGEHHDAHSAAQPGAALPLATAPNLRVAIALRAGSHSCVVLW